MIKLLAGDCRDVLATLPAESVQCVVTSPPYYALRSYLDAAHPDKHREIGSEPTPDEYLQTMVAVFREIRRVLRRDGTCWVNMGDSYAGNSVNRNGLGNSVIGGGPEGVCKQREIAGDVRQSVPAGLAAKQLLLMPARLALALQADGWWVRSDIIWHKPNPMPESCTDRPTSAHEHVFLLTKSARYWYDGDAVREPLAAKTFTTFGCEHHPQGNDPSGNVKSDNWGSSLAVRKPRLNGSGELAGRNLHNVWTLSTESFSGAHFATFPSALAERCIRAGTRPGDTVLDPFIGAGTTALVADRLQRDCIGIDLNTQYTTMAMERCRADAPLFTSFPPAETPEDARMADLFAGDEYERPKSLTTPRHDGNRWNENNGRGFKPRQEPDMAAD